MGNHITAQSVLNQLLTEEDIFKNALHMHDGLLGILFGYGKHNSMQFYQAPWVKHLKHSIPFAYRFTPFCSRSAHGIAAFAPILHKNAEQVVSNLRFGKVFGNDLKKALQLKSIFKIKYLGSSVKLVFIDSNGSLFITTDSATPQVKRCLLLN